MDYFNNVIVGSGPAGVAAALKLKGLDTCILDVGDVPVTTFPFSSLKNGLLTGSVKGLLGEDWGMLSNLADALHCHPKLRSDSIRHAMEGEPFRVLSLEGDVLANGRGSYAVGGMANAWGAQLLRYTDDDLSEVGDWPISATQLSSFYNELEKHIGISGELDDMSAFLGSSENLLPSFRGVPASEYLLKKYISQRGKQSISGLRIGRPRLAVLTKPYRGRPAYNFGETEFFSPTEGGIYNPQSTLASLIKDGQISYLGGHKLLTFKEYPEYVEIRVEVLKTREVRVIRAKHLLLGCGTIQTTKIVLSNLGNPGLSVPFVDHSPTLIPIFLPSKFGSKLPISSFPVQLIGTLVGQGDRDMISFYYPGGILWSDIVPDIPLPMSAARTMLASLIGGMLVAQIWETSKPSYSNRMHVDESGSILINYSNRPLYSKLAYLITELRSLGCFSMSRLASVTAPGLGFHHAGTLPMRIVPDAFETHTDGRLWNSLRVRVIDGSVLPSLPAKNHSLTIMANAARIGEKVRLCGY